MTILESRCDHPVTLIVARSCEKNLPSQMNYDTCLGSYRCYLSLAVQVIATTLLGYASGDYVALNLAGIGRTPQFAAGTSLSRVGSFTAMQRKAPALRPGRVGPWDE